ncbi:unnamed protein product [Aphanomyces euteiches]|uniref:Microsomal glutathione S-transferase 1 n=1 Tax=Aphanomyces euteiches TaxID=100861 RepID=A0A6G0WM75_9STRA|nr:hypothetical protein Ae201684_013775 [Aphanomyces euteiches]KAH9080999.1 hypothetical protein Ae201684P_008085 [Aphanomyces euteiches]KAH9145472.1 hypothetical protein AeRB84_010603 [Aphanomyces euteiches]
MATVTDIRIATLCTLVLYVKFIVCLFIQGSSKFTAGTRAPEDMAFARANPNQQAFTTATDPAELQAAKDNENRWNRIVGNDMENLPFGILLAWVSIIAGGNGTATSVFFIVFTICRIIHSVAFAKGVFLPRTAAWQIALLCNIGLAITAVVGAF